MVVGGDIAGRQTALDLANSGYSVCLEVRSSSIGGVMARLGKTFNVLWVMKRKALP